MPPGLDATRQMTDLNEIVDHHRQKYVEITKDCLWNELQNYCVESTEKKLVCLQIDCKHLQCNKKKYLL